MSRKKPILFLLFVSLLLADRLFSLYYFGFEYTDIDQVMLWNGAIDYSKGIFYEPYFYGQAYNFMLESFLAVPLIWMNIPVYMALPVITTLLTLLPYLILAYLFYRKEEPFWSSLVLLFPLILPLDFNLLTTLSRGFVQAQLFIPFLFIPVIYPNRKHSDTILFVASAFCFVANQSSILIIFPIALYVFSFRYKDKFFYLKSLLVIPILALGYVATYFYKVYPEKIVHVMVGMEFNLSTFKSTFQNFHLFENLFPFFKFGGYIYLLLFAILLVYLILKEKWKSALFLGSFFSVLLLTFAIPKFQELYNGGDIYFSSSRLYLCIPIVFILTLYFAFQRKTFPVWTSYLLIAIASLSVAFKNYHIEEKVAEKVKSVSFPLAQNINLQNRTSLLANVAKQHDIDVIITQNEPGWDYIYDIETYAFHPLHPSQYPNLICVRSTDDRRTWLYDEVKTPKNIFLHGMTISDSLLKNVEFELISPNQIVIKNNKLPINELMNSLGRKYGLSDW